MKHEHNWERLETLWCDVDGGSSIRIAFPHDLCHGKRTGYEAFVVADTGKHVTYEAERDEIETLEEAKAWGQATLEKLLALLKDEPKPEPRWPESDEDDDEDAYLMAQNAEAKVLQGDEPPRDWKDVKLDLVANAAAELVAFEHGRREKAEDEAEKYRLLSVQKNKALMDVKTEGSRAGRWTVILDIIERAIKGEYETHASGEK